MEYRPNIKGTGVWLRTDDDLRGACRKVAHDVVDVAEAIAPIYSGDYVRSVHVVESSGLDRVGAGVEASDAAAAPLEFGNEHTGGRAQPVLARAAEIVGMQVL